MHTRTTVSIGIPSFNEEKNIVNLLKALEAQDSDGSFVISEVIISDDSLDSTPAIVSGHAASSKLNIKLVHHKKRRGAAAAWNEIFKIASGEIIVLYDADTIPHPSCTRELVSALNGKAGTTAICASNPLPVQIKGVAGKASVFISRWLRSIRKAGLSQYTVMGRALSISSDIAKKILIPEDIIAIDLYIQCRALEMGMNVSYNDRAVVYFRPASSAQDLSSQVVRAVNGHNQIQDYISKLDIGLAMHVMVFHVLASVLRDPVGAISTAISYSLLPYYRSKLAVNSAKWHTAQTSKSIDYDKLQANFFP